MPPEFAPEFADVSVIIPAYRAAATIGRTLDSVAAQTLKPHQAIVVDDGSDDGTYEAALALVGALGGIEVKVFRQPRQGAGAARNKAVMEAACATVAFLDADDEWLPEKLERSLEFLEGSDYVLVAHNYVRREAGGTDVVVDCAKRFNSGGDPFVSLYERGYMPTCAVVARKSAVLAAGGFDTSLATGQDFDLWLAMLKDADARFHIFEDALARYHIQKDGITSRTGQRLECCLRIAARYAPELRSRPGSSLAGLWFRIIAVHGEALTAYRARGRPGRAFLALARLPVSLLMLTAGALFQPKQTRGRFLP